MSPHIILNLDTTNSLTEKLLLWKSGTPVLFPSGQLIKMQIMRPYMLALPCCSGKLYYCVKVRLKDAKCIICEKIVCFTVDLGATGLPIRVQEKVDIFEKDIPFKEGN